jgi:hypothetical protein
MKQILSIPYELTQAAKIQLSLMRQSKTCDQGFVSGTMFGSVMVVESFFSMAMNAENIAEIYPLYLNALGEKLMGIYFFNADFFENEWFLEDYVFQITATDMKIQKKLQIKQQENGDICL